MRSGNMRRFLHKSVSCGLLISTVCMNIIPMTAYAAPAKPSVDETLYLNLDSYGAIDKANIVKGISFNGRDSYTDFGNYLSLTNMSDEQKPEQKKDSVTWKAPAKGGKFFFQGSLEKDSIVAPWTFDISYKLNGVVTDADKIAGKSGLIEIDIEAKPNEKASEYMKNNMMLICAVPVDIEKCYSIDAPDSQMTTVGQYNAAVFTALPGQEGHYTVRLGTDKFESVGAIFTMAPGTVGDLKKIKDIKELKDTFRDDSNAIMDDFESILDNVTDMQSQLDLTNSMLKDLQSGKNKIHGSAQVIFNGNDIAIQDLQNLGNTLAPVDDDLKTAQWMVYDINKNLNTMDHDLMDASSKLKTLNTRLKQLGSSMSGGSISNLDIKNVNGDGDKAVESLNDVLHDLNKLGGNSAKNRNNIVASASEIQLGINADEANLLNAVSKKTHTTNPTKEQVAPILAVADSDKEQIREDSTAQKANYIAYISKYNKSSLLALDNSKTQLMAKLSGLLPAEKAALFQAAGIRSPEELSTSFVKLNALINVLPASIPVQTDVKQMVADGAERNLNPDKILVYANVMSNPSSDNKTKVDKITTDKKTKENLDLASQYKDLINANVGEDEEIDHLGKSIGELSDKLSALEDENGDLLDEKLVTKINSVISQIENVMEDGGAVSFQAARSLNSIRDLIGDIDSLIGVMNSYYGDVQKTLNDSSTLLEQIEKTSQDTSSTLQVINNTLRSAEPDLNRAADKGLKAAGEAVSNGKDLVNNTSNLKKSGSHLRKTINDKLDEEEADNNFLNMDPDAPKVSLTSDKNEEPTNISIIARSQEITVDKDEDEILDAEEAAKSTTLFQRISTVFVSIWKTLKGLFSMA